MLTNDRFKCRASNNNELTADDGEWDGISEGLTEGDALGSWLGSAERVGSAEVDGWSNLMVCK